jgi:hypothetical protein
MIIAIIITIEKPYSNIFIKKKKKAQQQQQQQQQQEKKEKNKTAWAASLETAGHRLPKK